MLIQQQLHKMQFQTFIIHLLQAINHIKLAPDVLCTSKAISRSIMKYQDYYLSAVSTAIFFWQCYLQVLGYMNLLSLSHNWETLRQKDEFSIISFPCFWELEYISIQHHVMSQKQHQQCSRLLISPGDVHYILHCTAFLGTLNPAITSTNLFPCIAVYSSICRASFTISPFGMAAIRAENVSFHLFFPIFKPPQWDRFLALLRRMLPPSHLLLTTIMKIQCAV